MNNEFYKILQFLITILLAVSISKGFTQEAESDSIAKQKMETLEQQVTQLIGFLEYSMNTLGTKSTPAREKETIIQESYRKIFANDNVQIEDDLDDKREAIVNKDVQAYLKDINFFFRDASFTLNINKITPQYNEHGGLFFIADIDRHLKAVTVSGDTMDNSLQRFIEFNYDEINQDLKIASIYTTKLNENEEMSYWWNNLPESWKIALGRNRIINDSLTLAGIAGFTDSVIFISRKTLAKSVIQKDQPDTSGISLPAVLIITDTIPFKTDKIFYLVRQILNLTEISVEKDTGIIDLEPLAHLRNLKKINCSYTGIQDLTPIRNLSQLEVIDCSHTKVSDFSVLRFSGKLRDLDAGYTAVSDLTAFSVFTELERLNLDSNNIVDLTPLSSLTKIRDLRFRGTWVDNLLPLSGMINLSILDCSETRVASLEPLKNLTNLERLYCSSTRISDLSPLSGLSSLKNLNIDNTPVSSLDPLNNLSELEKIYCDNTGISGKIAGLFMEKHPQVLVIYESQTLINWWNELTPEWQRVFASCIELDPVPTKEQLHEIANLTLINIQNNQYIKDLEPLKKLEKLESLDISFTMVDNLAPINDLVDLKKLNCKQSRIKDLIPLEDLINLESLDISVTAVSTIEPLRNLNNLQVLTMDETAVADLDPLSGSRMIRLVYCDKTPIGITQVMKFYEDHPDALVVYQTETLQSWWKQLDAAWQEVFRKYVAFTGNPNREDLHKIGNLTEIDISNLPGIKSLVPIRNLYRLKVLKAGGIRISDIEPLRGLKQLYFLDVSDNPITNLDPISGANKLTYLNLKNIPIDDLSAISGLVLIETLNVSGTMIKDLSALEGMKNLSSISFFNTRVKSFKGIEENSRLRQVECFNTKLNQKKVDKFKETHPGTEVVFY